MNRQMKKMDAIKRIQKQITSLENLRKQGNVDNLKHWQNQTATALCYIFGENHRNEEKIRNFDWENYSYAITSEESHNDFIKEKINELKNNLEDMITEISDLWENDTIENNELKESKTWSDVTIKPDTVTTKTISSSQQTNTATVEKSTMTPKKPSLFIGSSVEGLPVAEFIQANLDHSAEVTIWSQGVFGLSGGTLETLVREAPKFDFAVFVLTPDDIVTKRKNTANAARDNVLFELGLFMGILGRERTFIVHPRPRDSMDFPTDLAGITCADYDPNRSDGNLRAALGSVSTNLKQAITTQGCRTRT